MTILYNIAATWNSGGMERALALKANWLAAHGCKVYVVTTDQRGLPSAFQMDPSIEFRDLDINYDANNGASFASKILHYPYKQLKHRCALANVLHEIKPDIAISMFCNDASFLPRINDGSRKVLEIHFSRFKKLQYGRKGLWALADRWRYRADARIAAKYDKFVVLTEEDHGYWEDQGDWEFGIKTYSASMKANMAITPDEKNPTRIGRTIKSGYGYNELVTASVSGIGEHTDIQNAATYFPEFGYTRYWRLLEKGPDGYEFKKNEYSTYNNRTHFTPVWYPDGTYTAYTWVLDCWTPAGMLSADLTDSITISGNVYDDWHIAKTY